MAKQNVSLAFSKLSTAKKAPFGANVIQCLTTNATLFPALPVPVAAITTVNKALATALQNMEEGGKQARADLDAAISTWNDAFKLNAAYVNNIANGNVQTITKSGYNATKGVKQTVPVPGSCKNFHALAPKASGIINISCDADTTSHGYISVASQEEGVTVTQTGNQLAITAGGVTTYVLVSTRSKAQFENMPAGKQQYLSIFAFNASGAGPLTNGQQVIPQ